MDLICTSRSMSWQMEHQAIVLGPYTMGSNVVQNFMLYIIALGSASPSAYRHSRCPV